MSTTLSPLHEAPPEGGSPQPPVHKWPSIRLPPKTGLAADPLNIVILGGSYAGLACAHNFLDEIIDGLRVTDTAPTYRLVIVSPSTHFYWNVCAPRLLAAPDLIKQEDAFLSIDEAFHRHRGHIFSIFQGKCCDMDPDMRVLNIELFSQEAQKRMAAINKNSRPSSPVLGPPTRKFQLMSYHALIIATGASTESELLKLNGPHIGTIGALNTFHSRIPEAKSIVVAGAGPTAIEVAGQLAIYLNHKTTFPFGKIKKDKRKEIILVCDWPRLLRDVPSKLAAKADKLLKGLGVDVRCDTEVLKADPDFDLTGQTRLELTGNRQLICDIYIPCTGVTPNTSFLPKDLLDEGGYVATNLETLRVDGAGAGGVYAIGDCASYSRNCLIDVFAAVGFVVANMGRDIMAQELKNDKLNGENAEDIAWLLDAHKFSVQHGLQDMLCPITRFGGVGVKRSRDRTGWRVWASKGKDYNIGKAREIVNGNSKAYVGI